MAHVSAAERRPQLIKAAIDFMTREGVAAGSTRAIAAELGVAQATVHYTFGTKEGLYLAVMEQLTEDLVAQVERAAPADGGSRRRRARWWPHCGGRCVSSPRAINSSRN